MSRTALAASALTATAIAALSAVTGGFFDGMGKRMSVASPGLDVWPAPEYQPSRADLREGLLPGWREEHTFVPPESEVPGHSSMRQGWSVR